MKFQLPEKVTWILETLNTQGFEAYAVGGCVRDSLLGLTPEDWDICTSATPNDTKSLFLKTFDTGIKHGTVSVLLDGEIFEVTTFRFDGEYEDNRHPKKVTFTKSLNEDLARRDFTINAMAYNPKTGLKDPFLGQQDLEKKIIRCVGEPDLRFSEDGLRILRGLRFAAQKGFTVEKNTLQAMQKNAALVKNLSVERIVVELTKLLMADPSFLKTMFDLGILKFIMPEMCRCFETEQNIKWHIYDVGMHTVKVIEHIGQKPYLKFAALMHDWGKPDCKGKNEDGSDHFRNHAKVSVLLAENFLKRFKFSNKDQERILTLIKNHDREILTEKKYVKRAINAVGDDLFLDLLDLKRADCFSQNFSLTAPRMEIYDKLEALYYEIKENNETLSIKNLAVNGNDLIKTGFKGKEIGETLNFLLEYVIDHPEENEKQRLLKVLKYRD